MSECETGGVPTGDDLKRRHACASRSRVGPSCPRPRPPACSPCPHGSSQQLRTFLCHSRSSSRALAAASGGLRPFCSRPRSASCSAPHGTTEAAQGIAAAQGSGASLNGYGLALTAGLEQSDLSSVRTYVERLDQELPQGAEGALQLAPIAAPGRGGGRGGRGGRKRYHCAARRRTWRRPSPSTSSRTSCSPPSSPPAPPRQVNEYATALAARALTPTPALP